MIPGTGMCIQRAPPTGAPLLQTYSARCFSYSKQNEWETRTRCISLL